MNKEQKESLRNALVLFGQDDPERVIKLVEGFFKNFIKEMGKQGGKKTMKKHGKKHFSEAGKKGMAKRWIK